MEDDLRNHMYGWSNLAVEASYHPRGPLTTSEEDNNIVQTLTSLAFLLAPKPGQRVATSGWRSPSTLKIFWATNFTVESTDLEYIEALVSRMKNDPEGMDAVEAIIPNAGASIRQYASELAKTFGPILEGENLWQLDEQLPEYRRLRNLLADSQLIGYRKSAANCLDNFIRKVAHFEELNDDDIHYIVVLSGVLVMKARLKHFATPERIEALEQLGRYYVAVNDVSTAIQTLNGSKTKFDIEHLRGPEARLQIVNSATVEALAFGTTQLAGCSSEEPRITFDRISTRYPHATPGITPNRKITLLCQQHPTVTVCAHLMKQKVRKIYIGVSDYSCCEWCEVWTTAVSTALPRTTYLMSSRGECPGDWQIPEGVPMAVTRAMAKVVKDKIDTMFDDFIEPIKGWRFTPCSDDDEW